jgi:type II secretory pathway pseudopilin PulG
MRREPGFALALVLVALVLIGALTAGVLFAALQELRAGRNRQAAVRAGAAAEEGLLAVLGAWDTRILNALAPGDSSVRSGVAVGGGGYHVTATRLDESYFLLASEGRDATGAARQALGAFAALAVPEPDSLAALVVGSPPPAVLAMLIDGADVAPEGWNCPTGLGPVPPVAVGASASDSALFAAVATLAQRGAAGVDSLSATFAPGDFTLNGGRHLGLLVVGGDLFITGGAEVIGTVVVRGQLGFLGMGGRLTGLVLAASAALLPGASPPAPAIRFSRCAAGRALRSVTPGRLLPSRAMGPLY